MGRRQKLAYVVIRGRKPGIYFTWDETQEQVNKFPGARQKGYFTVEEAKIEWAKHHESTQQATETNELVQQRNPVGSDNEQDPWKSEVVDCGTTGLKCSRQRPSSWDEQFVTPHKQPRSSSTHDNASDRVGGLKKNVSPPDDPRFTLNSGQVTAQVIDLCTSGEDDEPEQLEVPPQMSSSRAHVKKAKDWQEADYIVLDVADGPDLASTLESDAAPLRISSAWNDGSSSQPAIVTQPEPTLSEEQQNLVDMIMSGKNVFYTGSAGTGKSTVLRSFVTKMRAKGQRVDIISPTGISALNVDGVTYYLYAGWNPDSMQKPLSTLEESARWQKYVHMRLCETKVLVIDEISMFENHQFERLNAIMKASRDSPLPFGGVQLIVTGDFCQLPPVRPFGHCLHCGSDLIHLPNTWKPITHKCNHCGHEFNDADKWAFCSSAWQDCNFTCVNLATIHRQSNNIFIALLEKCRLGDVFNTADRKLLLDHPSETTNAVRIFPRRDDVNAINVMEFQRLKGPTLDYPSLDEFYGNPAHSSLEDYFSRGRANMVPKVLHDHQYELKVSLRAGTKIVLLINLEVAKGLVNGSTGTVIGFKDIDTSKTPEYKGSIAERKTEQFKAFVSKLPHQQWPVIRFDNGVTRLIKGDCRIKYFRGDLAPESWASRTQLPLLPAWAMTVHKAQGMTLTTVEVDLRRVFEPGHEYVALSRAKTLGGLKVTGLPRTQIGGNKEVLRFLRETFEIGAQMGDIDSSVWP